MCGSPPGRRPRKSVLSQHFQDTCTQQRVGAEMRRWGNGSLEGKENTAPTWRAGKQKTDASVARNSARRLKHVLLKGSKQVDIVVADINLHEWLFPFAQVQERFKATDFLDPNRENKLLGWVGGGRWGRVLDKSAVFCSLSKFSKASKSSE